jgi:transcriptional antiterminator NusG
LSHRWYVVNTHSGFEKKVSQVIKEQAERKGLSDHFTQVLVPMEEVIEVRRGKKINAERKFFPGYILINMDMTDDTWHLVKETPKVSGFLGSSGKPSPISEAEAQSILSQVQEGVDKPKRSIIYQIGETVKVADGPFASFNGIVEDIDEEKERLKIAVSIFGRSTLVELGYGQVEKG